MAPVVVHILTSAILILLPDSFIYKVNLPFVAGTESVSSFFEIHQDYTLYGHVIEVCTGRDLECGLRCLRIDRCQSYNCYATKSWGTQMCRLNSETRQSRPEDFKKNRGSTYFEVMQVANSKFVCKNNGRWSSHQNHCKCSPGYKGITCSSKKLGFFPSSPGNTCKHIRDCGDSEGDGEYWIDPEHSGNPLKVYCDMTTDGGGWLLVANNFLMGNSTPPSSWIAETSYRGIGNYHNSLMGITTSAMYKLRSLINFTQLRFHCSKNQGRTFHVTTVVNSIGEAVVQYFSGQTDVLPSSCSSFQTLVGDNSQLAKQCDRWGNDKAHYVGKWGHYQIKGEHRMYNHAAFVANKYHWVIVNGNWLCDDVGSNYFVISPEDFWKIYVR